LATLADKSRTGPRHAAPLPVERAHFADRVAACCVGRPMTSRPCGEDGRMLKLASARSERGELTLLRRSDGALELRVNGAFAMDSAETRSERLLATAALDAVLPRERSSDGASDGLTVLVGGLGLGFTVAELVDDPRVAAIVVAEIEPDLVRWHRSGVVPRPPGRGRESVRLLLDEPTVDICVCDVRECVAERPSQSVDLVLLDVDNGPGFLLYDANADLYRPAILSMCRRAIRTGGATAIWTARESADLHSAMLDVFDSVLRRDIPVTLNSRPTSYHLYVGTVAADRGAR
jgi:spermidine synthase